MWLVIRQRHDLMLFSKAARPGMGLTESPMQTVPGALFSEIKQPRRETDHLPPPSAKFKNVWSCTFMPTHNFVS